MPFDASRLLAPITPPGKMDWGEGILQAQQLRMKREEMRRLREQFEEEKRHNQEAERLAREREAGENARAQLRGQQELDDDRRAALDTAYKYRDAGDIEGIESRLPQMNALGMLAERQGEGRYRFGMDAAAAEQEEGEHLAQVMPEGPDESAIQSLNRLNALGGPLRNERTPVDISAPGIRTSDDNDAANRFKAAVEHHNRTGQAIKGPDAPDWLGSVPTDVVDIGAEQASIAQRLNPALGALQNAYPEHQRESVGQTNQAAAAMNLPATEALKLAQSLRGTVDPEQARVQEHEWEVEDADRAHQRKLEEKQAEASKPLTRSEIEALAKGGEGRAEETFKNRGLDRLTHTMDAGGTARTMLTNKTPDDDQMIGFHMTRMLGSIGPQSNRDVAIALGIDSMSTTKQIEERINAIVNGGFTEMRKEVLVAIIDDTLAKQKENAKQFLDAIEDSAEMTKDPEVARGLREYAARNVPREIFEEWESELEPEEEAPTGAMDDAELEEEPTGAADTDDFETEVLAQAAEAGLDGELILPIVRHESGGKSSAVSSEGASGIMQIMPDNLRAMGIEPEEYRKLSAIEQIPYAIEFLRTNGIDNNSTADDYALAVAASDPKWRDAPDDTVIYPKGSKGWKANKPWRPADDGDITKRSILAFYGLRDAEEAAEEEEPEAPAETPRNPLDKSVLDILRN